MTRGGNRQVEPWVYYGQDEIADMLGVTQSAVGQVERRAIRQLWRSTVSVPVHRQRLVARSRRDRR